MDWIHCNTCFQIPQSGNEKRFFITSCGHIFCSLCVKPDNGAPCTVCNTQFTIVPLTSQMSPSVMEYFSDPIMMLKRAVKILEFQNGHRVKFAQYERNLAIKYKLLKTQTQKLYQMNEEMKKDMMQLTNEIKILKQKLSDLHKASSQVMAPPPSPGKPHEKTFLSLSQGSDRLILPRRSLASLPNVRRSPTILQQVPTRMSPVSMMNHNAGHSTSQLQWTGYPPSSQTSKYGTYRNMTQSVITPEMHSAYNTKLPDTPESMGRSPDDRYKIMRVNPSQAMRMTPPTQSLGSLSLSSQKFRH